MDDLSLVQHNLKAALPKRGGAFVLNALLDLLPPSSPKYNMVIALQAEYREFEVAVIRNLLSEDVKSLKTSQLNNRLLKLLSDLTAEDFDPATRRSRITENARIRRGNILYQIPKEMKLDEESRCLVRIAFDKEMLLEALHLDVHTELREQIRISDYMRVEIVDPATDPVFRIVARSEAVQLIDEDDYTEWRFLVTPLRAGEHTLELKISIMEHVNGEDRVREKTLDESVVIITESLAPAAAPVWTRDTESLLLPCAMQTLAPRRMSGLGGGMRAVALGLALLVGISSTAYAYGPVALRDPMHWAVTRYLQDNEAAYTEFLKEFDDSPRRETANFRRAVAIQRTDPVRAESAIIAYLSDFGGTAQYVDEAWWAIATITQAPEDYQQYINLAGTQPREAEAQQAVARLESSLWQDITSQTTAVQLDRYLRLYPQGSHRSQAIVLLADTSHWTPDPRLPERLLQDTTGWRTRVVAYAQQADAATAQQLQQLAVQPAWQISPASAAATSTATLPNGEAQLDNSSPTSSTENTPKTVSEQPASRTSAATDKSNTTTTANSGQPTSAQPEDRPAQQKEVTPASSNATIPAATIADIANNMVSVPGGAYTMGCQDGRDTDCEDSEKPPHEVTVSTFYLSKYEVTQAQWRAVMGSDPPELNNTGCDQCPVERVSWNDIQEFLQKLNAQTGQKYRLPTEAEWEYAARGGQRGKANNYLYSGSNTIGEVAWYDGNAEQGNTHGAEKTTRPVGGKKPNELGLYDMSGNVYEWCSDWYGDDYYENSPQQNPRGPGEGTYRVLRGGGWGSSPRRCRAAPRNLSAPTSRNAGLGFRLAR